MNITKGSALQSADLCQGESDPDADYLEFNGYYLVQTRIARLI